ncbi:hypothetical protein EJ110_NYTH17916 [Nymphaea thermarum]|nr:hypothetical protein EJ110_NYTH17916 [Nymphaea thermarum]
MWNFASRTGPEIFSSLLLAETTLMIDPTGKCSLFSCGSALCDVVLIPCSFCSEVTPQRQLKIKTSSKLKQNSQGQEARDSGHPSSRSYSGSAGSSPYSSPMPVRCRSARFTRASSGTLDLYIDGEQYDGDIRPKQDSFEYTCAGEDGVLVENRPFRNVGRPPRCQVSSGLDSSGNNKKVSRSHSFREFRDVGFPFSSRDGVESLPSSSPNHDLIQNVDGKLWNVLPRKSRLKLQEVDAETSSTLDEDGDNCLKKHPLVGPYPYVPGHEQSFDHAQFSRTNMNNSSSEHMSYPSNDLVGPKQAYPVYQEQEENEATKLENFHDRDEQLLEECKAAEERLAHVSDEFEQHVQSRALGSGELIHMVKVLNNERRKLATEVVEQMHRRMMEREYMKNTIEMAKIEHEALVRKIEKEKNEIQSCLERELDRRSSDWSSKHEKFKQEEKRLRERVRDLAEQNVSLQREVVSLSSKEVDDHARLENKELQLGDLKKKLEESMLEVSTVQQSLTEMEERCKETEAERDLIGRSYNKKEIESKDLQRVVVRLQKTCNDQEKTINGLRLNLNIELGKATFDKDDYACKLQMEELRLTGLEQTLRKELDSSRVEIEMLRKENIGLLERLQTTGNGGGSATVKLDQELHARTESLQDQGLFLLDQSCSMCDELLDYIKMKLHKDSYLEQDRPLGDGNHQLASYSFLEIDLKLQRLKQEIESFKRSLQITSGFLHERFNLVTGDCRSQLSNVDENEPKQGLRLQKSQVNTCFELEAEVLVARVLREKLWSKEVELEHLQTELASSVRLHDILKSEIQRTQDSLSCLTHKVKDLELEVGRKNETVNKLEMEAQDCQKELAALKGMLSQISKERDLMWEQVKEYSEKNMLQNYELDTLRKKIEALDEEILLKEGQITILKDSLNDRPCEILYSPKSSQDFSIGKGRSVASSATLRRPALQKQWVLLRRILVKEESEA